MLFPWMLLLQSTPSHRSQLLRKRSNACCNSRPSWRQTTKRSTGSTPHRSGRGHGLGNGRVILGVERKNQPFVRPGLLIFWVIWMQISTHPPIFCGEMPPSTVIKKRVYQNGLTVARSKTRAVPSFSERFRKVTWFFTLQCFPTSILGCLNYNSTFEFTTWPYLTPQWDWRVPSIQPIQWFHPAKLRAGTWTAW